MEKTKVALTFEGGIRARSLDQKVSSVFENSSPKRVKPRALVFKAHNKDLDRITELIREQFPEVEILYVTTGPAKSFLHVTKSMPFELQDSSQHTLYTVNGL